MYTIQMELDYTFKFIYYIYIIKNWRCKNPHAGFDNQTYTKKDCFAWLFRMIRKASNWCFKEIPRLN